jgi:malate dehydrogenase
LTFLYNYTFILYFKNFTRDTSMAKDKITIVGAGNVGATSAHIAVIKQLGDIVLLDVVKGLAEGKALDIAESAPLSASANQRRDGQLFDSNIIGTTEWQQTADSHLVIVTGGLPRKPGMSRDDLLKTNAHIVKFVSQQIAQYSPDSIVIVVSNPLDAMVYTAAKTTGFAKNRIMGMAGALDSARFSYFLAQELGVSVTDIKCLLMGGHGDDMVPLPRFTTVSEKSITELLDKKKIAEIIERTRNAGIEIVNLLGYSAYYAPAAGVIKMAEAILKDKNELICCSAYCAGEYNASGYFVGVPAVLGRNGVEKIIELDLNDSETAEFQKSLEHVKQLTSQVDKLL